MTEKLTTKRTASDSDSDSEDDAQMRQFMEAADTTLLTNAMFQADTNEAKTEPIKEAPPAKSERYLEEQDVPAGDLQITKEMQTHIWSRLSGIIQSQIEFEEKPKHQKKAEKEEQGGVRLVSNADCYLIADLVVEGPAGPTRKPTIKRRVVDEDETSATLLQAVAVSGESVLEGKDVLLWAEKKSRPEKLFQYRSSGGKLLAIEPTNEFTKRRRQNNWNESKIARKKKNKS
ncbi:hypothetical protein KR054_002468 [Drosophila jambulina]|nr:hypothetical protein KR054_002468 [Drosophila jambulina]